MRRRHSSRGKNAKGIPKLKHPHPTQNGTSESDFPSSTSSSTSRGGISQARGDHSILPAPSNLQGGSAEATEENKGPSDTPSPLSDEDDASSNSSSPRSVASTALGDHSILPAPSNLQGGTAEATEENKDPSGTPSPSSSEDGTQESKDLLGAPSTLSSEGSTLKATQDPLDPLPLSTPQYDTLEVTGDLSHLLSPPTSEGESLEAMTDPSHPPPSPNPAETNTRCSTSSQSSPVTGNLIHHETKTDQAVEQQQPQSRKEHGAAIEGLLASDTAKNRPILASEGPADARDVATLAAPAEVRMTPGEWMSEILDATWRGLKKLITRGLVFLIIAYLVWVVLAGCFSAMCNLPAAQRSISVCKPTAVSQAEFSLLTQIQSQFDDVQDHSLNGVKLPFFMLREAVAVREVGIVVATSNLPSRSRLKVVLEKFHWQIVRSGENFTTFDVRINGAVDSIITTNFWTTQALTKISEADEADKVRKRSTMAHFIDAALVPLEGWKVPTEVAVRDRFIDHLSEMEKIFDRLIREATKCMREMTSLEESLYEIQEIAAQDNQAIARSSNSLTTKITTIFGLDVGAIGELKEHTFVLNRLLEHRQQAQDTVSKILGVLFALKNGLIDLREQVAEPSTESNSGLTEQKPIAKQIETINQAMLRLGAGLEKRRNLRNQYIDGLWDDIEGMFGHLYKRKANKGLSLLA